MRRSRPCCRPPLCCSTVPRDTLVGWSCRNSSPSDCVPSWGGEKPRGARSHGGDAGARGTTGAARCPRPAGHRAPWRAGRAPRCRALLTNRGSDGGSLSARRRPLPGHHGRDRRLRGARAATCGRAPTRDHAHAGRRIRRRAVRLPGRSRGSAAARHQPPRARHRGTPLLLARVGPHDARARRTWRAAAAWRSDRHGAVGNEVAALRLWTRSRAERSREHGRRVLGILHDRDPERRGIPRPDPDTPRRARRPTVLELDVRHGPLADGARGRRRPPPKRAQRGGAPERADGHRRGGDGRRGVRRTSTPSRSRSLRIHSRDRGRSRRTRPRRGHRTRLPDPGTGVRSGLRTRARRLPREDLSESAAW